MNFYDFNPGSNKPFVHLGHANGFPPATYAPALKPLLQNFHVASLYVRPFWPDCPLADTLKNWKVFSTDLLTGLDQFGTKPVIAIGHSLGGVASLYAAVEHPERFSHVILIDPTMLPPAFLRKATFMKWFNLEPRKALVEGALRRRKHWDSREQAYESFKQKSLFKKWPDEILRAYVEGMTLPDPQGGVKLAYSAEWEAQIYRTIPTDVWRYAKRLQVPTLVIRGEISNTFMADSEKAFRKACPLASFTVVPHAGHLVPQEAPNEVGKILADFLGSKP